MEYVSSSNGGLSEIRRPMSADQHHVGTRPIRP